MKLARFVRTNFESIRLNMALIEEVTVKMGRRRGRRALRLVRGAPRADRASRRARVRRGDRGRVPGRVVPSAAPLSAGPSRDRDGVAGADRGARGVQGRSVAHGANCRSTPRSRTARSRRISSPARRRTSSRTSESAYTRCAGSRSGSSASCGCMPSGLATPRWRHTKAARPGRSTASCCGRGPRSGTTREPAEACLPTSFGYASVILVEFFSR